MKRLLVLPLLFALVVAGCGDDDGASVRDIGDAGSGSAASSGSSSGSASASTASESCHVEGGTDGSGTTVALSLSEWAIVPSPATVAAGKVTFASKNTGEEIHELVVIKGAKPDQLTIGDEGLDEAKLPAGADVLGEVEPIPAGETCEGTFELAAGDYVLVCNIVEEAEHEAHAAEGMVVGFTVT